MPPTRRHLWALHEAPKVIVGPQPIYEHTRRAPSSGLDRSQGPARQAGARPAGR